jgi:hypothetical protein
MNPAMVPSDPDERMARATAYPFHIPPHSFVFRGGRADPCDDCDLVALKRERVPVIACGSNQSPAQLARKYHGTDAEFLVMRGWLNGFDAVYSAHITSYGSVAATLQHMSGAAVSLSVMWLDADQLVRMHATESPGENYVYTRLDRLELDLEGGATMTTSWAYTSLHGCLVHQGSVVPLAAMPARKRRLRALEQRDMLRTVHERLEPAVDFETFMHQNIDDATTRRRRIRTLRADAEPFRWPHAVVEP